MSELELIRRLDEIKAINLIAGKEALTVDEACSYTGLSKSYVYKLCQNGKLPHYKSRGGKQTYFSKAELDAWMLHTPVLTDDRIRAEAETIHARLRRAN